MGNVGRQAVLSIAVIIGLAAYTSAAAAHSATPLAASTSPAPAVATNTAAPTPTPAPPPVTGSALSAKFADVTGSVLAKEAQDPAFAQASLGYILKVLGQVQTHTDGKVRLDFSTGTLLRLGPQTLFTLQAPQSQPTGLLNRLQLTVGRLWIILDGGTLEADTPSGVAAVQGSLMSVDYDPTTGILRITCLEGHCSLLNAAGTLPITTGETAKVIGPHDPPLLGLMTPEDYQDWLANMPEATGFVPVTGSDGLIVHTSGGPKEGKDKTPSDSVSPPDNPPPPDHEPPPPPDHEPPPPPEHDPPPPPDHDPPPPPDDHPGHPEHPPHPDPPPGQLPGGPHGDGSTGGIQMMVGDPPVLPLSFTALWD